MPPCLRLAPRTQNAELDDEGRSYFGIAVILAGLASVPGANAAPSVLSFVEAEFDNTGLWGASAVAISPDGLHVYATGAHGDAVSVFSRGGGGRLSYVEEGQG